MRNPKKKSSKKKKLNKASNAGQSALARDDMEMGVDEATPAPPAQRPKVWQPGVDDVEEGEELQFDPSAYHCLHPFGLSWPCLSFDILRDALGDGRKDFPHSMFAVAGTQADSSQGNTIALMRLSNLTKMKQRKNVEDGEEDDDDDSDSEEEEEGEDGGEAGAKKGPRMQLRTVAHHGGVNRIRSMEQNPNICATWGETGHVQVWDMSAHIVSITEDAPLSSTSPPPIARQAPLQIFSGHKDEGFALDWSGVTTGRLLTGDCKSGIHLWEPSEGARWTVDPAPFTGHTGSVEDLQWSPTEAEVFASCSSDQKVSVWDARSRKSPALSLHAHHADVNVISWNRLASCMLASGADDGTFRIWDLRAFKEDSFVAHFKYHTAPITSIEWSFHDSSTLATSSADNQLTVWDLSLERDPEEEAQFQSEESNGMQAEAPSDLPPQLLFVHQGQKDIKELHWHAQIPGLIMSTARDGFNVFRPSNL